MGLTPDLDAERSPFTGISRNVLYLSVVSLLTDISSEMIYPLVPLFLWSTLGAPVAIIGVVEGLAETTASLLKGISGALSDRLGRRKPFLLWGYGLAALTKPLLAVAHAWPVVLAARVLDRFGKGLRGSPRDAMIADSTQTAFRGRAFGFHRSGDNIGAVCGPLLAIPLLAVFHQNLRSVFLCAFVPGLLSTLLILKVRDSGRGKKAQNLWEGFHPRSMSPGFRLFLLVAVIFAIGNSSDAFLILRAKQLGAGTNTVLLMFTLANLVNVLSSYPAGMLSDRWGRKRLLIAGFLIFAAVYYGFGTAASPFPLWLWFAAYGVYLGLTEGIARALVVDLVPEASRGTALGIHATALGLCALPASLIAGLLWQRFGLAPAFLYGAATALVSAALFGSLRIEPSRNPSSV
ncbi:MAG: MFS transporter [Bryobacteraceae bacterium]